MSDFPAMPDDERPDLWAAAGAGFVGLVLAGWSLAYLVSTAIVVPGGGKTWGHWHTAGLADAAVVALGIAGSYALPFLFIAIAAQTHHVARGQQRLTLAAVLMYSLIGLAAATWLGATIAYLTGVFRG